MPHVIVFANIDAISLRPPSSSARHARVLESVVDGRVTIVPASYRTRAQIEALRAMVGMYDPFIAEHGAAAFVPDRYFGVDIRQARISGAYHAIEFGGSRQRAIDALRRSALSLRVDIETFEDMSVEQVARALNVPLLDARLAALREYDEAFRVLTASPFAERRLLQMLLSAGLVCTGRGPFIHAGTSVGPGAAVAALGALFALTRGAVITAAWDPGDAAGIARRTNIALPATVATADVDSSDFLDSVLSAARAGRAQYSAWAGEPA